MSFFKRNKDQNLIPPVASEQVGGRAPSPSRGANSASPRPGGLPSRPSANATYNASRDGDPYNAPSYRSNPTYRPEPAPGSAYAPPAPVASSGYTRTNAVGDQYSRGEANIDRDRSELFAGYNKEKAGSGRFFNGPGGGPEPAPGEENDEDVEGIKQQTRFIKQESVQSTRNAIRLAREAEETARNTMLKLGDQSEKLANTERHLDLAKGHSQTADDRTDELKQLNRSIFRPVITFNKDAKRRAREQQLQERFEEDRAERERGMADIRETQNRLGRAATYGRGAEEDEGILGDGSGGIRGKFKTEEQLATRKAQRARYQFEATASDDEIEDEIDENLDELGDAVKRMKALGLAMGQEVDNQIGRIGRIEDKTSKLDQRVWRNTERLKKVG